MPSRESDLTRFGRSNPDPEDLPLIRGADQGDQAVTDGGHLSVFELHKRWARLEDEHHQLAAAMTQAKIGGADLALLRKKQAKLLLDINALVFEISEAPATTLEDYLALLDVVLDHETDLAGDIAFYGAKDYPTHAGRKNTGVRIQFFAEMVIVTSRIRAVNGQAAFR
jgi:hypothetical protein